MRVGYLECFYCIALLVGELPHVIPISVHLAEVNSCEHLVLGHHLGVLAVVCLDCYALPAAVFLEVVSSIFDGILYDILAILPNLACNLRRMKTNG